MKSLADECCAAGLVEALRSDGHDVLYVMESMRGIADTEVLHRAHRDDRIVLTEDKDFGELVYRLHRPAYGIILLRFAANDEKRKILRLRRLIQADGGRLQAAFVVLDAHKARIRHV